MPQAGGMADDNKNPTFSEHVREQLLVQRILVLDGVLDDDNGTLLATQLLRLAAEDPAADVALWINSPGGSVPFPTMFPAGPNEGYEDADRGPRACRGPARGRGTGPRA